MRKNRAIFALTLFTLLLLSCACVPLVAGEVGEGIEFGEGIDTGEPTATPTTTPTPTATSTPIPTTPPEYPTILNISPLWQYLYTGDFLGLINAIYLTAFQLEDLVVGVILMLIFGPLYIKTKNLTLCAILWILLGGIFIVAAPMLSALAVVLLVLGVGSLLWRLVRPD